MNPLSSAVATGGIVTVGQLVQHKSLTFRQVAAVGIYGIMLAGINETSPKLAQQFALLVLVGVLLVYVPPIVKAIGIGRAS
jgi:hypothetical protein